MYKPKKFLSLILSIVCILPMMLSCFAGCVGGGDENKDPNENPGGNNGVQSEATLEDIYESERPDYGFDYDSSYERPDAPSGGQHVSKFYPDADPAYANSSATQKTRMEAENAIAEFEGTSTTLWKNQFSDVNNMAFDFRLSNKLSTRNLNGAGYKLKYTFNSDKSYTVKMNLCVSIHTVDTYNLGEHFTIKSEGSINDNYVYSYVDLTDKTVTSDQATVLVSGGSAASAYFKFAVIELNVAIYEGENTLTFEHLNATGGNFDYIEFDTSANITGFDNTHYMDGNVASPDEGTTWSVGQVPTDDAEGTFIAKKFIDGDYRTYAYGLPALKTNGELTPGYTAEKLGGQAVKYSFAFKTGVYSFTIDPDYKTPLTINDANGLKFSNGTNTMSITPGEVLKVSDLQKTQDGRAIQLFNVLDANNNVIDSGVPGTWVVPRDPVTIVPTCYSPETGYTNITIAGGSSGKINGQELSASTFYTNPTSLSGETAIKGESYAQKGKIITTTGTITVDSALRIDSGFTITAGAYEFKYNFENKGTSKIKVRVLQFSASSEYRPSTGGDITMRSTKRYTMIVELDPGQSITLTAQYTLGANGNILTYMVADAQMVNMKLGMSIAVKSLGNVALSHPYAEACVAGTCGH